MITFPCWSLLHWLLGFITILQVDAATTGSQNITSDAFFYGLSPPVYPTRKSTRFQAFRPMCDFALSYSTRKPTTVLRNTIGNLSLSKRPLEPIANFWTAKGTGTGSWAAAYAKAAALVAQMTLDEKVAAAALTSPILTDMYLD
jgi:hypothetical protein